MTELSFLIDLLLNHKLPKPTRDAIAARIKDVECRASLSSPSPVSARHLPSPVALPPHIANQTPSMQAIMLRNQDLMSLPESAQSVSVVPSLPPEAPMPVAVIAQTPATVAALNERHAHIAQARSGKPIPGETKPRKW